MLKLLLSLGLITGMTCVLRGQQIDYKGFPQWSWQKYDSTEYFLYTPAEMAKNKRYPVVLVLHGCCGDDYHATLRTTVDPLVRVWHNFGKNTQDVPAYIVAPKTKRGWTKHFINLKSVIDDLIVNHQADGERIYITGFSMGASGTWQMLEKYPGLFAAAIPVGMTYTGTAPDKIKHIPVWTFRGETDWWARNLGQHVADFRKRNGWVADSSEWVTGVNPRFTTFAGLGHGVMWEAVSQFDLPGWLFSKINDGNKYPVAYFTAPAPDYTATEGEKVSVELMALDPDGKVAKVMFLENGEHLKTLGESPWKISIRAQAGDSKIEAIAFDNTGKTVTATTHIRVKISSFIITSQLPTAKCGELYRCTLSGKGNGQLTYLLSEESKLPVGLTLSKAGVLQGVPQQPGKFQVAFRLIDEDGDTAEKSFMLAVRAKDPEKIMVTQAQTVNGQIAPLSSALPGELPFFDRGDQEVSLSHVPDPLIGLTLIQTHFGDTTTSESPYLSFKVDAPASVFIAYEKLDNQFASTVPEWLSGFKKMDTEQIIAQYYYYDVYKKDFPAGIITLPGAMAAKNGVNTNYFVLVRKK